jgi:hypothetical protein
VGSNPTSTAGLPCLALWACAEGAAVLARGAEPPGTPHALWYRSVGWCLLAGVCWCGLGFRKASRTVVPVCWLASEDVHGLADDIAEGLRDEGYAASSAACPSSKPGPALATASPTLLKHRGDGHPCPAGHQSPP